MDETQLPTPAEAQPTPYAPPKPDPAKLRALGEKLAKVAAS